MTPRRVSALVLGLLVWQGPSVSAEPAPAPSDRAVPAPPGQEDPVLHRLRALVARHLEKQEDAVVPRSRLREDLWADSLDLYELLYRVEEEFGVIISDEEADALVTIDDLYQRILTLRKP